MARGRRRWSLDVLSVSSARRLGIALIVVGICVPGLIGWVRARAEVRLRPELVRIPGGTFWMGSPEEEARRDASDESRHQVTLTHDFFMCNTEVTQAQWQAVMGENPSNCEYGCGDDVAVHDVSWEMAVEYLNALSDKEGLEMCYSTVGGTWKWDRNCEGYRLPTEAEWEYAARAGTESAYSFGDDSALLGQHAWFGDNSSNDAQVVGTKLSNDWGLHDVHGNVREWVWDWYATDYGQQDSTDPVGPETGNERVLRGGAFDNESLRLRSAYRIGNDPINVFRSSGLRCARGSRPSAVAP